MIQLEGSFISAVEKVLVCSFGVLNLSHCSKIRYAGYCIDDSMCPAPLIVSRAGASKYFAFGAYIILPP